MPRGRQADNSRNKETTTVAPTTEFIKYDKETIIKYYLFVYNVLATLGWSYILVQLLFHLLYPTSSAAAHQQQPLKKATHFLSFIPFIKSSLPSTPAAQIKSSLPPFLVPYFHRATTAYVRVGEVTAWVQTLAVLELVHALMGLVRTSVTTTGMQVFSRLVLVWGIAENYEVARNNPLYASMVFAWSLTEVIRYAFYACSLVSTVPYVLLYLRYTTFFVLYPLGAGSEAFLIYVTLPNSSPHPVLTWRSWIWGIWTLSDYVRGLLFVVWWPSLYVLYTHMINQRRKVLNTGHGHVLGSKKSQ